MKILFLGYKDSSLIKFLQDNGENVLVTDGKINRALILYKKIEFIISYGYRHLIKKEILDLLPNKVMNLHISFLPWNKGADPNFWSVIEDTPKGVTIHYVDEGLDTGDILLQEFVEISHNETLRTSYDKLQHKIQDLFIENWADLKEQRITPKRQKEEGSFHKSKDKEQYIFEIKDKWLDMKMSELIDYVTDIQMSRSFVTNMILK